MAKKDFTQQMAKGLGSMLQPTTATEPTTKRAEEPSKPTREKPTAQPTVTASSIEGQAAVGAKKKAGRPRKEHNPNETWNTKGLTEGYTRATIITRVELLDKMKEMAYQNRSSLKAEIEQALATHIEAYETKNGKIKIKK